MALDNVNSWDHFTQAVIKLRRRVGLAKCLNKFTPRQRALVPAQAAQAFEPDQSSLSRLSPFRSSNPTLPPNVKAEQFFYVQFTEFRFKHSPEVVNVQFNTTMLLEIGKATLVGGISADTNDFLMVTLSK